MAHVAEMGTTLVIADDGVIGHDLRAAIASELDLSVVREASGVDDLLQVARESSPDTVVLGFKRRHESLRAVTALAQTTPQARVIAIVPVGNSQIAGALLHAGATAVARSDGPISEVLSALASGAMTSADPDGAAQLAAREGEANLRTSPGRLTSRETEVLELLALGHTNAEVADLLGLSVRTVQAHRAHLQFKLGARSRAELFREAMARGLLVRNGGADGPRI